MEKNKSSVALYLGQVFYKKKFRGISYFKPNKISQTENLILQFLSNF